MNVRSFCCSSLAFQDTRVADTRKQMFEVTTLGQPLEVVKTQMASNRAQTMPQAVKAVWGRGKLFGFYQGL